MSYDSKMMWECRSKLNEAGKKIKVSLICVSGHSEIQGNILARKSVQMPSTGPESFCGIGKNTYKKEFLGKAGFFGRITQGWITQTDFFETARSKIFLDLSNNQLFLTG